MTAEQDKALAVVQKALEKQMPKKPFNFNNLGFMAQGQCPCCTYCVTTDFKYCGICGQALDWSGKNDRA